DTGIFSPVSAGLGAYESTTCSARQPDPSLTQAQSRHTQAQLVTFPAHRRTLIFTQTPLKRTHPGVSRRWNAQLLPPRSRLNGFDPLSGQYGLLLRGGQRITSPNLDVCQ